MSTHRLARSLLARYMDPRNAPRVLFVLGAGTSLEAGLPLWTDPQLKRDIADRMVRAWGRKAAFLREAWASLAPDIGFQELGVPLDTVLDLASTDQLCAVACRTALGRRALVQLLCERFPDRDHCPHPQLACELLAHLLKHRFADYVVTLNFDELLDASLDDELGEDGYAVVLSNHRVRRRKEGIPWLFKLHGTISQQDSLRFTRDTTSVLTDYTVEALNEAMPAAEPLTVISLGYSWQDNDLAQWLRNRQESISEFIVVSLDGTPAQRLRRLLSEGANRRTPVHAIKTADIVDSGRPATVDEVLWACWKQVRAIAPRGVSLPSAARHLLVSHLFPSPAPEQRWWPSIFAAHNCASRSEAELFIATAKANGMVTMSALARDPRVHRWLQQLRDDHKLGLHDALFLKANEFRDVTEVFFFNGAAEEGCLAFYKDRTGARQSFSKARIQNPWN